MTARSRLIAVLCAGFAFCAAALPYEINADGSGKTPPSLWRDNGDNTVSDSATGLMWVKERGPRVTWADGCRSAAACRAGGYSDWRMPTIKELYSLILFSGANGRDFRSTAGFEPFIDSNVFDFAYGSGEGDERVIDAQDWSATRDTGAPRRMARIYGVNFTDGRLKAYPLNTPRTDSPKKLFVRYVRGNPAYGKNEFHDNNNGTVTDRATGLVWCRSDSGKGLDYPHALEWIADLNRRKYLGHNDWRLPTVKELQSLVDYSRSPAVTSSPAIDPVFSCTRISNEAGESDYPCYWSSTMLKSGPGREEPCYVAFGRAMGLMHGEWTDVHGAGAQRSDPGTGDPRQYSRGRGPQGDAVRIYNFVRPVRRPAK
ncbi:MAG: DUF1566 domain-containing protein [Victivallaceae bacterium]